MPGLVRDALGLTLLFLLVTTPLWTQSAHPGFDADGFFAPFFMLAARHAREGQFFLWDPWTSAGLPACAHPEIGVFSPLMLGFGVVLGPTYEAFLAYWLFFWWLGGLGMMVLARHLGAPRWGAFIAASGFFLGGFFTGHGQTTSWVHSFAGLPWIIWRLDASLRDGRWWPALEAGAIWGFFGLAGYPPIQLSNLAIAWFWALAASSASWSAKVRAIVLMTAVGAVVVSPSYVSFALNGHGYSDRTEGISRQQALDDNALDPKALFTFSSPYLAAIPRVLGRFDSGWINTDIWSMSLWVGGVCCALAVAGFSLRPLERQRLALLIMAVAGLLLAMGRDLPFRGWLFDSVPPSRFFRHASLFANTYHFALPALAALGARDMSSLVVAGKRGRLAVAWVLLAAAALGAFEILIAPLESIGRNGRIAQVHLWTVWFGLAALGLAAAGVARGVVSERAWVVALVTLACFDVVLGVVLGYPVFLGNARENWQAVHRNRRDSLDLTGNKPRICSDAFVLGKEDTLDIGPLNTNKHALVGQPRLDGYNTLSHSTFTRWLHHAWFRTLATGPDRFWFAANPARAPDTLETRNAFAALASQTKRAPAVIEGEGVVNDDAEPVAPIAATVREYRPTSLILECDAPEPGWLIVTDRWAPGWGARVNGQPKDVARAEFFFRAVPIDAGRNLVEFTYVPLGHLPWLVGLSWGTLLIIAIGGGVIGWRQRSSVDAAQPDGDLDDRVNRRLGS